ncbi:hypothetical protein LIER_41094 [Lithospermum erythrorhizon]|uniref:Uncharacterized protein n=1 Tax=Lithospermum erythrorhizon TaxID=34254 RepID=A0AAV3R5C6_LITER
MLVDTGSFADILYISTFGELQLPRSLLQPLHTPLTGFTGYSIYAIGVVTLDFTVGAGTKNEKRVRENHLEVNVVRNEEEEDNSPKERESANKGEPHEEIEEVPFKQVENDKSFRTGTREYEAFFAWGPKDMHGIDLTIVIHRLYVDPTFSPIKQKKRNFNDEKNLTIRKEVQTLLKPNAIRELKFPNWIANVVLVKKPNNKW